MLSSVVSGGKGRKEDSASDGPRRDGLFFPVLITVSLLFKDKYDVVSLVCIATILICVAFFEIGPGPIHWFIGAELSGQGPCPAAMAVADCSSSTSKFLIGLLFPQPHTVQEPTFS